MSFALCYKLDCDTFAQKAVSSVAIINFLTIQDVMAQYDSILIRIFMEHQEDFTDRLQEFSTR